MAKKKKDQDTERKLETMEAADLIELNRVIDQQIARHIAERRQDAVAKLRELADDYELSLDELFGLARGRKKRSALPAKYRHPEFPDLTWTGLGRRPQWLLTYVGEGGALEDLRI